MEKQSIYCAVRTEPLNVIPFNFRHKGLKALFRRIIGGDLLGQEE